MSPDNDATRKHYQQQMEPVEWKEHYTVESPELDQEHQALITLINDCISLLNANQDSAENIIPILNQMIRYTEIHFEKEEHLMNEGGYPHLENHKLEHREFHRFIHEASQKLSNGKLKVFDLLTFLKDWFAHHVGELDRDYIPYTTAKNRKP